MRNVAAVFIGGFVGTSLRFVISLLTPVDALVSPWIINVLGAFVLGLLVSVLWTRDATPEWLKVGLGTGLLGGFTTFSAITLALAGALMPVAASVSTATTVTVVITFVVELLLGFLAAWGGLVAGAAWAKRLTPPDVDAIVDEGVDL